MNILFVSNYIPTHNGSGPQRRAANHLDVLRTLGAVTVVFPSNAVEANSPRDLAEELGVGRVVIRQEPTIAEHREALYNESSGTVLRFLHAIRRISYLDGRVFSKYQEKWRVFFEYNFDLIFAFRMTSALWLDSILPSSISAPKVVDLDDIESITFSRAIGKSNSMLWRFILRKQLRWIKRVEAQLLQNWTACILCSEIDSARLERLTGRKAWVIPNAVAFREPPPPEPSKLTRLLFVGTFAYNPNVEGIEWFVNMVWPKVVHALGASVTLTLVGFSPPQRILEMGETPGITVVANAPTLAPYYADADIVIVPLLTGSGTRIKIIEAASQRRALVTTTLGCEGLDYEDRIHAEISDSAEEFSERIVHMAQNNTERETISANAYEHARARFSREVVQASLSSKLHPLISRPV
jgi:glycosyltransferase involved in cell wall biosynthesis